MSLNFNQPFLKKETAPIQIKSLNYKEAGVDQIKSDLFTEKIKKIVGSRYQEKLVSGIGGFAALYDLGDRYLASGTDGVGTKLKLAIDLNIHHTIGIDLVAMCVNDVLCTGATPLFFLDYLASSSLNLETSEQIIKGIVDGCHQCKIPLIGGETAEMPGFYPENHYDLAGFCVGDVKKDKVINGQKIKHGDILLGLPSSGFHSNGFSLLRKLISEEEIDLKKELLTPTKIYTNEIMTLINELGDSIKGLAHITGSGFENIPRMNPHFIYRIASVPQGSQLPLPIDLMLPRFNLPLKELYQTFNMGIGMVIATDRPYEVEAILAQFGTSPFTLGHIEEGDGVTQDQIFYDFIDMAL